MSNLTAEDVEVLVSQHQFLRDDVEDGKVIHEDWKVRMARKVYSKLYKECAIVDLSNYKSSIGLRWRTEEEVFRGKGTSICASKRCASNENINGYEVPFAYVENGQQKTELVKVNVCSNCAPLLFYRKMKKDEEERKKEKKEKKDKKDKKEKKEKRKKRDEDGKNESEIDCHRAKREKR